MSEGSKTPSVDPKPEEEKVEISETKEPETVSPPTPSHKQALTRKRKSNLPDVSRNLKRLQAKINQTSDFSIKAKEKGKRGLHNGTSKRRSKYIGVSRNKTHWQTLINVGRIKRYIGTYQSEIESAMAYDFYAIGLHGQKASTNFTYSSDLLTDMINSYLQSRSFEPYEFTSRIITA